MKVSSLKECVDIKLKVHQMLCAVFFDKDNLSLKQQTNEN